MAGLPQRPAGEPSLGQASQSVDNQNVPETRPNCKQAGGATLERLQSLSGSRQPLRLARLPFPRSSGGGPFELGQRLGLRAAPADWAPQIILPVRVRVFQPSSWRRDSLSSGCPPRRARLGTHAHAPAACLTCFSFQFHHRVPGVLSRFPTMDPRRAVDLEYS